MPNQKKPIICCPVPPKTPRVPSNYAASNKDTLTTGLDCSNPLRVTECPKDFTLIGQDCAGNPVEVKGNTDYLVETVQAPGTVFNVKLCDTASNKDYEIVTRCDPITGDTVLIQWNTTSAPPTLVSATNLVTGQPYTGDLKALEQCPGAEGYGSVSEVMCDSGKTFIRWFATKDGKPQGSKWDTSIDGTLYVVTDEAKVSVGECSEVSCTPTISSAFANSLTGLLPGKVISVQKPYGEDVSVTTSAGMFIVSKELTSFSTSDFGCAVEVLSVTYLSGDLVDVVITTQNW
jgi:hypothetical protein